MTYEDDFRRAIDANPDDWQTRLVFADWLDENGDPRAEGYRAMGILQIYPYPEQDGRPTWYRDPSYCVCSKLPEGWYEATASSPNVRKIDSCWVDFNSRREAEDAASLAFANLPASRRAELIAQGVAA